MNQQLINTLKEYFSTQPVEKAWIFGSYAREEETDTSDIDILVTYTVGKRIGFFGIVDIIEKLESLLGKKVDLVERGTYIPELQKK